MVLSFSSARRDQGAKERPATTFTIERRSSSCIERFPPYERCNVSRSQVVRKRSIGALIDSLPAVSRPVRTTALRPRFCCADGRPLTTKRDKAGLRPCTLYGQRRFSAWPNPGANTLAQPEKTFIRHS